MSLWLAIVLIVVVVTGGNMLSGWMERAERRRLPAGADASELRELRERVEELSRRVERLSEEQGFLTRLLEGRAGGMPGPASEDREPEEASEWSRARTSKAT